MKQIRSHEWRTYLIHFVLVLFLLETSIGCSSIRDTTDYVKDNYEFQLNGIPVSQLVLKTSEDHLGLSLRPITEWDKEYAGLIIGFVSIIIVGGFLTYYVSCVIRSASENIHCVGV